MSKFLETYGVAIFTLVLVAILIAFAGPIGLKIKEYTLEKAEQTEQIGNDEVHNSVNSKEDEKGEAFAVYSADDNSISFYKRETLPNIGEEFEGKTVTKIYTGIETTQYNNNNDDNLPGWINDIEAYYSYYIVDEIKPISTVGFLGYATEIHNIENLDTSNVTDMTAMFYCDGLLTSLDLSNFDTSNVIDMQLMFYECKSLTNLKLGNNFNTSKVINMSNMFSDCNELTSLDLSTFNTSNVTNMSKMFFACNKLTSLDLSTFNTSNVTDMSEMFAGTALTTLDLKEFDTHKVTNMENMFRSSNELTNIKVSQLTFNKINECVIKNNKTFFNYIGAVKTDFIIS